MNAAFIGAGFLAGTVATGLVLRFATHWRSLSTLPPALWVLATTLFAATLIHEDRFKWDYPPTWVWLFVYAAVPLAVPFLVARQRRVAEPVPPADPRLNLVRVLSAVFGVAIIAGAVALYVAPVEVGEHWPWALTPLLGRAVAAWYALFGTMLLTCAWQLRQPSEALIPYATLGSLVRAPAHAAAAAPGRRVRRRRVDRVHGRAAGALGLRAAGRLARAAKALASRAARAGASERGERLVAFDRGGEGRQREFRGADDGRPVTDALAGIGLAAEKAG